MDTVDGNRDASYESVCSSRWHPLPAATCLGDQLNREKHRGGLERCALENGFRPSAPFHVEYVQRPHLPHRTIASVPVASGNFRE